ncbi:transporter substrate-binding domain-containing protein [Undibacterium sp. Jales W-56]|uniref:substrate-binding periplasmic protein n=1 Tax=Undibacterium sp. Jales W-56 TaxID=2897325 RepID=UPI0021D053A4|nr:transporter substrate-binding domain-containing protein [Undibacterium sp. Jales W-56]MCU6432799.1 transporter substrate-binding domain-containing protein [Undibacterium sp. Jales W-56]
MYAVKKIYRFLLFLSLMLVASLTAAATMPLLIAESRDENGDIAPIRPENQKLIDYFERALDLQFEIRRYPLPRLVESVKAGEGIGFGLSKSQERLKVMRFSEAIFTDFVWVVARNDSTLKFNTLQDLQGKSVGIVRGIRYGEKIDSMRGSFFKVEEDQPQTSSRLKKLLSGRMDVMLFNSRAANAKELEIELNQYVKDKNLRTSSQMKFAIKVFSKPFLADDIHFTAGLQSDRDIIEKINLAIIKGRRSGELPQLFRQ